MNALRWILSIVGAVGITGAIALAVVAPAVFMAFLKIAMDFVARVWATRTGACVIVGAACLFAGNFYGVRTEAARSTAANAETAVHVAHVDTDIATSAEKTDEKDSAAEAKADAANTKARNEYVAKLEKRAAVCEPPTPDDLRRLRNIR